MKARNRDGVCLWRGARKSDVAAHHRIYSFVEATYYLESDVNLRFCFSRNSEKSYSCCWFSSGLSATVFACMHYGQKESYLSVSGSFRSVADPRQNNVA